jgi:cobalt-zinc-cadmium efflux system protein
VPQGADPRPYVVSAVLTLIFVAAEAWVGYSTKSLALLSDAGHNLSDFLALGFSLYAIVIARRPSDSRRTYGYHRVGILAALANSVSLVLMAVWIFYEAISKLRAPEAGVESGPMIGMAAAAIVLNGFISLVLKRDAHHDLNARSAYLHMLGDALSAAGVLVAGLLIRFTGYVQADAIASVIIGVIILLSSWGVLQETVNVLLEGVPGSILLDEVETVISEVEGVLSVHDLHVWTVSSGLLAASCHIQVTEQSILSGQQIIRTVNKLLLSRFGIGHATIQVEVEGCDPDEMYCSASRHKKGQAKHG